MGIKWEKKDDFKRKSAALMLVSNVYRRIFHEEMSGEVTNFFQNLFYVFLGTIVSTTLLVIFTITGGRILGPEEYGKFVLVQSVAMFLYIPMLFGFNTAMLKNANATKDERLKHNIIVSIYLMVFIFTVISIIVFLVFAEYLADLFKIQVNMLWLSITFAGLYVFYVITTSTLRSLQCMRAYSIFQMIYSGIILSSFLIFVFSKQLTFKSMVYSVLLGYSLTALFTFLFSIRRLSKWHFDKSLMISLLQYAMVCTVGGLSFVFYTNIDKIMISRYMEMRDIGIYNAYYSASLNVIGIFSTMFILVFFPTVSKYKNKKPIYNKINKFIPYLFGFGIPSIFLCEFIILKLYGGQYSINWGMMALFAITSVCTATQSIYAWLLNSVSTNSAKIVSIVAVVIALINIGMNFILIPKAGLLGAISSLLISYCVSIFLLLHFGKSYYTDTKIVEG